MNDDDTIAWVTLTTVSSLPEGDMLRSQLESNGIATLLPEEGVISINPLYAGAVGGLRVQVRQKDLAQAREILNLKEPAVDKGIFECPRCGSGAVEAEFTKVPMFFGVLCIFCLGLPLLWFKKQCRCGVCGFTWKQGRMRSSLQPNIILISFAIFMMVPLAAWWLVNWIIRNFG